MKDINYLFSYSGVTHTYTVYKHGLDFVTNRPLLIINNAYTLGSINILYQSCRNIIIEDATGHIEGNPDQNLDCYEEKIDELFNVLSETKLYKERISLITMFPDICCTSWNLMISYKQMTNLMLLGRL